MLAILALVAAAAEAAPSPCLQQPLAACLKVIGTHMKVSPVNDIKDQLARLREVDVNGKPLSQDRKVMAVGTWPGEDRVHTVFLDLDDHDIVTAIEFEMPRDPQFAQTTADYDRTKLYEMARTVFDPTCWGGDRLSLYRFFQNDVKPKIKVKDFGEEFDGTDT